MSARGRLLAAIAPLVLAVGGAVLVTWPLARHMGDHLVVPGYFIGQGAVPTSPDTYLHLYILAWVHHALETGAQLFDANIMYPATGTLAGSEHMLGHWPLYGPVYAESANAVLAYNWVLLSSFALNALAVHALVRRWTSCAPAGLVAAAIYAWAPLRFAMIDTVQHLNVAYLPLLVLFADHWWEKRSVLALVAMTLLAAWQALCSYYLAYATAVVVVVLAAAAWGVNRAARGRVVALLGAGLAGLVPTALLARPYLVLRAGGAVPEYGDVWLHAASASPAWFLSPDMPLFAGYLALAFAVVGLVAGERLLGRFRVTLLIALFAAGFVLVLGPTLTLGDTDVPLPYRILHAAVPGFASLRYPYRFGVLSTFALAVLAGTGFAAVWRHAGGIAWALAGAVTVVVGLEYRHAPLVLVATDVGLSPPRTVRWLAEHGRGRPLLEWPIPTRPDFRAGYEQSRTMAFSTHHWLPILNGYTAYAPPSFGVVSGLAERLPDADSLATLVDLTGVELLVLHRDRLPAAAAAAWNGWLAGDACRERLDLDADVVCALPTARRDLRARLVAANSAPPRESLDGVPLTPLPTGQQGRLEIPASLGALGAGLATPLALEIENAGTAVWPGLAPLVPGVVVVRHRWRDAADPAFLATPILCDVAPGARCKVIVGLVAPQTAGAHELELGLAQHQGAPIPLAEAATRVYTVDVRAAGHGTQ